MLLRDGAAQRSIARAAPEACRRQCLRCAMTTRFPMLRTLLLIASIAGLLTGCALPGPTSVPTAYPVGYLPTVIYLTAEAINATVSAAITPTDTPTEVPTPIPSTPLPTGSPTPAPGIPLAAIQINAPGPMSRIISPLQVHVLAVAGASHKIEVDLYGEDGRLLGRTVRAVQGYPTGDFLSLKIPFEIRAAGENGLIQVSTKDDHGRLQSLSSVGVLLLSSGVSQINPAGNGIYERVTFYHPAQGDTVSGGSLALDGQLQAFNRRQVIFELISNDGRSLSLRLVDILSADPQDFSTTLPYTVNETTSARLYVYQYGDTLHGCPDYIHNPAATLQDCPIYVYSQEITLQP